MLRVRPAEVSDASVIVEIMRSEFPQELLCYTVFGCDGAEQYVRDGIRRQQVGPSLWHVLAANGSRPVGFAEVRRSSESIFLNHLYSAASARGPGIGPSLMFHALTLTRNLGQPRVELDVFSDNVTVRRGHQSLGFEETFQQRWVEVSLVDGAGRATGQWHARGLGQADRIHRDYGFSEFCLQVGCHDYRIGRLGDRLFRATDAAVLEDPCALRALRSLGPDRTLLCIDRADRASELLSEGAVERARSLRMAASLDDVLGRLSRFRRF